MQQYHDIKAKWRDCYLRTEEIPECDQEAGFSIYPSAGRVDLKAKLEYLKENRQNPYSSSP